MLDRVTRVAQLAYTAAGGLLFGPATIMDQASARTQFSSNPHFPSSATRNRFSSAPSTSSIPSEEAAATSQPVRRSTRFLVTKSGQIISSAGKQKPPMPPWIMLGSLLVLAGSVYSYTLWKLGGNLAESLEKEAERQITDAEKQKRRMEQSTRNSK